MKWSEIRKQYPDKFILLGDISEEKISETKSRVIEGKILRIRFSYYPGQSVKI